MVAILGWWVGIKIMKATIVIRPYRNESFPRIIAGCQTREAMTGRRGPVHVDTQKYISRSASEMVHGRVSAPRQPQHLQIGSRNNEAFEFGHRIGHGINKKSLKGERR